MTWPESRTTEGPPASAFVFSPSASKTWPLCNESSLTFFVVEVVATRGQNLIDWDELNDFTFRQVGGLVEYEAAVVDVSFERLHRIEVYSPAVFTASVADFLDWIASSNCSPRGSPPLDGEKFVVEGGRPLPTNEFPGFPEGRTLPKNEFPVTPVRSDPSKKRIARRAARSTPSRQRFHGVQGGGDHERHRVQLCPNLRVPRSKCL